MKGNLKANKSALRFLFLRDTNNIQGIRRVLYLCTVQAVFDIIKIVILILCICKHEERSVNERA